MNFTLSLYKPIVQTTLIVFFTAACASLPPRAVAQYQGDGGELGATLRVSSANPLEAVVTIRPSISFQRVLIEVANDVGGSKLQCRLDNVIQRQVYSCPVSGVADSDNSGLVISVTGIIGASPQSVDLISQKQFVVPNPSYDREGSRKKQDQAEDRTRLQTIRPNPQR